MANVLLHGGLFHALSLLDALSTGLKDAVHLAAQSDIFCSWAPGALVFYLAQHLFVPRAVQWVVFLVDRSVVEVGILGHDLVHIIRLDFEEQRVRIGVQELAALSILRLHLVIVKVVHEMLGEVKGAQAGLHRPDEKQVAFVHLNPRKVIIKDVGPCKGRAGNKTPELVFLVFAHEFDVNALAKFFYRLPKYRLVHQLIEVFFEV